MKIKIISDGTAEHTTVVNAETNEALQFVSSITWSVSLKNSIAKATIEFDLVALEATGKLKEALGIINGKA